VGIKIAEQAGSLLVEISDGGIGGAVITGQGGLQGLVDRVAALGGRLKIDSQPGSGTRLSAQIPCA
jgi:signal transduction histidine kinase